jgi:hypothetical protein
MKPKFYSFLLACLFASTVFAQKSYEDVVYLKNGSVIRGMIVEQVPNVSLSIKSGLNLFVYKLDEIAKYTREPSISAKKGFGFKSKGFVANYEIGLTDFPKGTNLPMFSIMLVNGYQFSPYISVGLGVGAEISAKNIYNVPIYADLRAYFTTTRLAPFFNLGFGYNAFIQKLPGSSIPVYHSIPYPPYYYYSYDEVSSNTSVLHGLMFNPSVGARYAITQKVGVTLSVGYKLLDVVTSGNHGLLHGATLRTGVVF